MPLDFIYNANTFIQTVIASTCCSTSYLSCSKLQHLQQRTVQKILQQPPTFLTLNFSATLVLTWQSMIDKTKKRIKTIIDMILNVTTHAFIQCLCLSFGFN